jgi:hypothetical protein
VVENCAYLIAFHPNFTSVCHCHNLTFSFSPSAKVESKNTKLVCIYSCYCSSRVKTKTKFCSNLFLGLIAAQTNDDNDYILSFFSNNVDDEDDDDRTSNVNFVARILSWFLLLIQPPMKNIHNSFTAHFSVEAFLSRDKQYN